MPKQKSSLFFISLFALLLTLFCQFHFVNASLFPLYAPLIMSLYLLKLETVLFLFLFAGLFLDMIAMSPILGFYGGLFLLIAPCLFSIRTYFFQDSFSTLFVLTFLFSLLFTIGKILCRFFFALPQESLFLSSALYNFLLIPIYNGSFAMILFYALPKGFRRYMKQRSEVTE